MLPQPTHLYQSEFISFFQIFPSLVFGTFPSPGAPRFYLGEGVVYQVFLTLISFLNLAPKPKAPPFPIPGTLASSDTQHGTPLHQTHRQQPLVFLLPDSGCLRIPHPHSSPEQTTACGFLPFRGHTLLPPADSCSSCSSPTDTAPLLVISSHPRASASGGHFRCCP